MTPSDTSYPHPAQTCEQKRTIENAYHIAVKDLRSCYTPDGILAGKHIFPDYWARDALFACEGALVLKDSDIVRKQISLFLRYQKEDGQIPLRITSHLHRLKYLNIRIPYSKPLPTYLSPQSFAVPVDQNSLLVILAKQYYERTLDHTFIEKNLCALQRAMTWNLTRDKDDDGLIEEGYLANWADCIIKRGKVLYSNVLHYAALSSFVEIARAAGERHTANLFLAQAKKTHLAINTRFWNGTYYIDWIGRNRFDYFTGDGNMLAIIHGIADRNRAAKISQFVDRKRIFTFTLATSHPQYPPWRISLNLQIAGMRDYAERRLWVGCLGVRGLLKLGRVSEARSSLCRIAQKIVEYGTVHEVFRPDGKPIKTFLYESEHPFAWSAGQFIAAADALAKRSR